MRRSARLLSAALVTLAVGSCDSTPDPTPVTFGGVAVSPAGGTTLALSGNALVVTGVPTASDGGFSVDGARTRVDVEVDPVSVPEGGRFGVRVEGADGTDVASFFTEGLARDRVRLAFSFADASAVTRVQVLYKLGGQVVFRIPALTLTTSFAPTSAREGSAGTGEGGSGSVHVIREGSRYIVVGDSEGGGNRSAGSGGCAGYLLTPPDVGTAPPPDLPICADWVEVQPLDGVTAEGTRTSVLARGVGQFTVRSLVVR
ncbi:MAG TPA: hypothetical protein VF576_03170 [Rubricoccaceae bacterium]|jgi:hypothetical protein